MLDKIKGGLFGVAIGDALGGTTEFMTKEEIQEKYGRVTEIIGGGIWALKPGETTDDTAIMIAVLKGIMANSNNPIEEIGKQFLYWEKTNPKDIGITTRTVFENYEGDWFKAAAETHYKLDGRSAGNGSLMRCLPVVLAYSDKTKIDEISVLQSKITHYDDLASEACVIYNRIARRLLEGEYLQSAIKAEIKDTRYDSNFDEEPDCAPDGYVVHTLKWVLFWLMNCETFEEVVIGATNMGHDSDTVAAIAGGLKGLEVGFSNLPEMYCEKLVERHNLEVLAEVLFEIRDENTELLKERSKTNLLELETQTNQLYKWIEQESQSVEKATIMDSIKKNIYLCRITLHEENPEYDKELNTWCQLEQSYRRSRRLLDLGAPTLLILHELDWLLIMIDHMNKRFQGIEHYFTDEQLQELESLALVDWIFERE
ncbi:ADP-ribosylglycohydrolase family protein [Lysinibacillus contaminans]|uniref:ADP-ribosylglycohydrolase family protein n=1 Tax=Lysinibacillus contaminans TaxID=1293441 RepID=UPI000AA1D343